MKKYGFELWVKKNNKNNNKNFDAFPFVSISIELYSDMNKIKSGKFEFRKEALRKYSLYNYSYVQVYFDKNSNKIGFRFLYDSEPGSMKINFYSNALGKAINEKNLGCPITTKIKKQLATSFYFTATSFFDEIGLVVHTSYEYVTETKRFLLELAENDDVVDFYINVNK